MDHLRPCHEVVGVAVPAESLKFRSEDGTIKPCRILKPWIGSNSPDFL